MHIKTIFSYNNLTGIEKEHSQFSCQAKDSIVRKFLSLLFRLKTVKDVIFLKQLLQLALKGTSPVHKPSEGLPPVALRVSTQPHPFILILGSAQHLQNVDGPVVIAAIGLAGTLLIPGSLLGPPCLFLYHPRGGEPDFRKTCLDTV